MALDFKVRLHSGLFFDVCRLSIELEKLKNAGMDYEKAFMRLRGAFSDLTDEQFLEIEYEYEEFLSVLHKKAISPENDARYSNKVRRMLINRSERDMRVKSLYMQALGRGKRMHPGEGY